MHILFNLGVLSKILRSGTHFQGIEYVYMTFFVRNFIQMFANLVRCFRLFNLYSAFTVIMSQQYQTKTSYLADQIVMFF